MSAFLSWQNCRNLNEMDMLTTLYQQRTAVGLNIHGKYVRGKIKAAKQFDVTFCCYLFVASLLLLIDRKLPRKKTTL